MYQIKTLPSALDTHRGLTVTCCQGPLHRMYVMLGEVSVKRQCSDGTK